MAVDPGARAAGLPGSGVLIVGYGNPLRSDDGVGPAIAERLASDPRFAGADVRAEHQLTPELALDASTARLLLLVDADDALAPGEVAVRELRAAGSGEDGGGGLAGRVEEAGPPLTHHVDPASLLALAAQLWGAAPRAVVAGVGPASLELGDRLTPVVEAAVPRALDALATALARLSGEPPAGAAGEEG